MRVRASEEKGVRLALTRSITRVLLAWGRRSVAPVAARVTRCDEVDAGRVLPRRHRSATGRTPCRTRLPVAIARRSSET